jgi:hypothetical protein
MFSYVAKCKYPGHEDFYFFTREMVIDDFNNVQDVLKDEVRKQWKKVSPHTPPEIIEILAGLITLERQ